MGGHQEDGGVGVGSVDATDDVDAAEAGALYGAMGPGREISGGSAANSVVGAAALGARTAFVGRVAGDRLGHVFTHDIRAAGVAFDTAAATGGPPTGRCLIVVTPDGERTMNTYLGACQELDASDLDAELVAKSGILYLEGYLWDPAAPRAAMQAAIKVAREAGNKAGVLPYTLVIDPLDRIVTHLVGGISEERMRTTLKPLLK
jgi:sugar/nucleoside kinase (ribokinase family)